MVEEGDSGAARPVEHQFLPSVSQSCVCAGMRSEGLEREGLTVGARDCLIEYVRCIVLSSCSSLVCVFAGS